MSAAGRAFLRPREDLRQVGKRFTGGLVLIVPDPLQISRRLAFAHRASYFPANKEALASER